MTILDTLQEYKKPENMPKVALFFVVISLLMNAYLFHSVWNIQYENIQSQQTRLDAEVSRRAILQSYVTDLRNCIDNNISPCPKSLEIGADGVNAETGF